MTMMNWKTTVGGLLAALGQALQTLGVLPGPWSFVGPLLTGIGTAILGLTAADAAKTPKK